MIVKGQGSPLLVIPGLQGHWQWMRPGIDALAAHHRVATYSLAGESDDLLPLTAHRFDDLVRQARNALARAGVRRAAVCGVSYGALIATRLAARHPDMVSALVLASPLPPDYRPDARVTRLLAHPRLMAPGFVATAPRRTLPEIRRARPRDWAWCATGLLSLIARWPQSPVRMAERVGWLADESLVEDAQRVRCPTLVVTGDNELDVVVPPETSRRYLSLIPQATAVTVPDTGHFGMVTRPLAFAAVVHDFLRHSGSGAWIDQTLEEASDAEDAPVHHAWHGDDDGRLDTSALPWGDLT